ncbi:hypothetical protein HK097_007236 [Rhizophlyctis rosea]|uniref:Uncharacterized protein n=1 Tax=Rhizophlyctis rosea TaxID=64517 RepID=A0AAD5SDE2_9FUNG|nr:hypothetical protein HK097_007236 [Rhizophlyctis rosea]
MEDSYKYLKEFDKLENAHLYLKLDRLFDKINPKIADTVFLRRLEALVDKMFDEQLKEIEERDQRHQELEERIKNRRAQECTLDAYNERISTSLNLPRNDATLNQQRVKDVRVVNLDDVQQHVQVINNNTILPQPAPRRESRSPPNPPHNAVQMNPVTREISTTSTQTIAEMGERATSSVSLGIQTERETPPVPSPEDQARMAVDPPLTQIVTNYHHQTTNINNYLSEYNSFQEYYTQQQNVLNNKNTKNHLHQLNQQANVVQLLGGQLYGQNIGDANPYTAQTVQGRVSMPDRQRVGMRERLMITAPPNQPIQLPVPQNAPQRRDSLPAYNEIDMGFGDVEVPHAGGAAAPRYPLDRLPATRNPARVGGRRGAGTRIIANPDGTAGTRGIRLPGDATVVQMPDRSNIPRPEAWTTYMRGARATAEPRRRDEGWFNQGIDNVPKPGTKRKGGAVNLRRPQKLRAVE